MLNQYLFMNLVCLIDFSGSQRNNTIDLHKKKKINPKSIYEEENINFLIN